jgi:hypothetical protein
LIASIRSSIVRGAINDCISVCERDKKGKQGREQHNSLKGRHGLDVQTLTKRRIDAQQCEKPMVVLPFSAKISLSDGRDTDGGDGEISNERVR